MKNGVISVFLFCCQYSLRDHCNVSYRYDTQDKINAFKCKTLGCKIAMMHIYIYVHKLGNGYCIIFLNIMKATF